MNRLIYPVFLMLLSCKSDNSLKYYTYEKWSLPEEFENSYLKDNPLEVKETLYVDKNDYSLNVSGRLNSYELWKFNNDGDIIFHKLSTNSDSFWIITKYKLGKEGLQAITYDSDSSNNRNDTNKIVTENKETNFLEMQFGLGKLQYSIISFSNDGNTKKQEFIEDTNKLNDISTTQIDNYDNDRIQKKELITNDGLHKMISYFYTKEKYLDSIISYDNDTVTTKEFFIIINLVIL